MSSPVTPQHNLTTGVFQGGIHLAEHKKESISTAIQTSSIAKTLTLPLRQHLGIPATAQVRVGDSVLRNTLLATPEDGLGAPIHAPASGTVVAIEQRAIPHPSGLTSLCIVIETDDQQRDAEPPSCPDPIGRAPDVVAGCINMAGIVGLGGATFPTYAKIHSKGHSPIDTVVINAAECEPYITCDDMLMRERAAEIIDGMHIIMHALRAERCLIGIEDNKREACDALQQAIDTARPETIQIIQVPTLYPSGGERQLIKLLTDREVPSGGLPLDIGIACFNVGTAAAVHRALRNGQPLTSRIVTITGSGIHKPCNIEAPLGTPISHLIEQAGGYTDKAERLIMGGPMMGFALSDDSLPVVKATNCILVASADEIQPASQAMACIRCGYCATACPMQLLPQQLYWYARAKDMEKVAHHNIVDCIECGICAYVCPSHIPLVDYFRFAKNELAAEQRRQAGAERTRLRVEAREARQQAEQKAREEKLAKKRAALKNKKKDGGNKATSNQTPMEAPKQ